MFFIIWRFSLLRGTNLYIEEYAMAYRNKFIMRGFSLLGGSIIGGSTHLQHKKTGYQPLVCMPIGSHGLILENRNQYVS